MTTEKLFEVLVTYNRLDKSKLSNDKAFEVYDLIINEGSQFLEEMPKPEFYESLIPVVNDALSNSEYEALYKTYLFRILFFGLFAHKNIFQIEIKQMLDKFHIQTWKLWDESLTVVFDSPQENKDNLSMDYFYSYLKDVVYVNFWAFIKGKTEDADDYNKVLNWMGIRNKILVKRIYNPYA